MVGEGGSVGVGEGVDGKDGGCGELDGSQVDHHRGSLAAAGSGEEAEGMDGSG